MEIRRENGSLRFYYSRIFINEFQSVVNQDLFDVVFICDLSKRLNSPVSLSRFVPSKMNANIHAGLDVPKYKRFGGGLSIFVEMVACPGLYNII